MTKPENREINSLNGITPTRSCKPRPSATTAALTYNERGRHSLLLNGDEGAQGSPNLAKVAFTLAEVLITLGIIGVVAAMTLPTLIQNYRNKEVESKLQKIYTVMNQAIALSEVDNGPKEYWDLACTSNGTSPTGEDCTKLMEKYFLKYISYNKLEDVSDNVSYQIAIFMDDATVLIARLPYGGRNSVDFHFYPKIKNYSKEKFLEAEECGISYFSFLFAPTSSDENSKWHYKKGFEPYAWHLDAYTIESMREIGYERYLCKKDNVRRLYCTALIRLNGWKIPKDYPVNVK